MADAIDAFIDHALTTRWADLPPHAQEAVRIFMLDTIGVGIAGAGATITVSLRAAARQWGGPGSVHVWGRQSWQTDRGTAAFINAFQIHCQEFDCVHEPAVVHPLATIFAAMMAEAESRGDIEGACFGTALAVAVDLAAGIGVAVKSPIRFFRPANAGIFGATLGVGLLRGFDRDTLRNALGYALSFASGTMQAHTEGKPALPVQIGQAARGAIHACDLAEAGMQGPARILEGPYGYFPLFEAEWDLAPVLASLGRVWRIAEVSHKPFPTGRAAQGGIVLMQQLRAQGITAGDIAQITLTAPPLIPRLVGRPWTQGLPANYARLSFAYCGAVALTNGTVTLNDFTLSALASETIARLAGCIAVTDDGSSDPAAFTPQSATAMMQDGRTFTARIDSLYGSPADPLTRDAHLEKFRGCTAYGWQTPHASRAAMLIEAVDTLEKLNDVSVLSRLAAEGDEE